MTQSLAVYTLARLMATVPGIIKPTLLVKECRCLEDRFEINEMHRLKALLADETGSVYFRLEFGTDAQGLAHITGRISTKISLICQRCLDVFQLPISNDICIGLAFSEDDLTLLPDTYEPILVMDDELSLMALIEDEMLLTIPMAPTHELADCPSRELTSEFRTKKESPFAILKNVKK